MTANRLEIHEVRERIAQLTREEQFLLAEAIMGGIREDRLAAQQAHHEEMRAGRGRGYFGGRSFRG